VAGLRRVTIVRRAGLPIFFTKPRRHAGDPNRTCPAKPAMTTIASSSFNPAAHAKQQASAKAYEEVAANGQASGQ